jgi:hypothetical protein
MSLERGDVVFGCFPGTDDATLLNHYSVVLAVNEGMALLVYTTSGKGQTSRLDSPTHGWFSQEDRALANWPRECRYDVSRVAVVPLVKVRRTGRISARTQAAIEQKVLWARSNARASGFRLARYNAEHREVRV